MGARLDRIVKGTLRGNPITEPARGPRDLARARQRIIEAEDKQLASVAASLDATAASTAATVPSSEGAEPATVAPTLELQPEFDPAKPFAEVRGEPGVGFVQGENYFSRDKLFAKRAPEHAWYSPAIEAPKAKAEALRAARSELHRLPEVPRAPRSIIDAERENAKAAAAELFAE